MLFPNNTIYLSSPDKNVTLKIQSEKNNAVSYSLNYKKKAILEPSLLGFQLNKPKIDLKNFNIIAVDSSSLDETWKPVWGEVSSIRNNYKQLVLTLKENQSAVILKVTFRVFNEGLGFRYEFPTQENFKHFIVGDELTQFNLAGNHKTFWIPGDYDTNEYLYNTTKLSEIDAVKAADKEPDIALKSVIGVNTVQCPLMMKTDDGIYINIHEAALINYPAMNLTLDKSTFTFTSHLVPDAVGNKAYLQTSFQTPWRTINVSDKGNGYFSLKNDFKPQRAFKNYGCFLDKTPEVYRYVVGNAHRKSQLGQSVRQTRSQYCQCENLH